MSLSRELARWALDLSLDDVPGSVLAAARRHLLDGIGCALGAVRLDAVPAALTWAEVATAPEQATVIGTALRRPTHVAAGVNGYAAHALDFDDTHAGGLVHATSVVMPTALAVGEEVGASGEEVLVAAVAGYEVLCRLAAAAPHGFHRRGLHATAVCGVFAAALVTARLRRLDVETTVHALGLAGSMSSGSLEFLTAGTPTKALHPGLAAANGVLAATLAAGGAQGPDTILEGSAGLYRVHADVAVDPREVTDGLGATWETERITIKPYPVCQLVHAGLDALRSLDLDPTTVASVVVELPEESVEIVAEPAATKRRPRTEYEAKFSLPWSVATAVVDGDVVLDAFEPARRDRAEVLALADRVTYESFTPDVAAADAPGRVTVTLEDGATVEGHVPASRGGPANPLTDDDVAAKFHANAGGSVDADRVAQAVAMVADAASLDELMTLLRTG